MLSWVIYFVEKRLSNAMNDLGVFSILMIIVLLDVSLCRNTSYSPSVFFRNNAVSCPVLVIYVSKLRKSKKTNLSDDIIDTYIL